MKRAVLLLTAAISLAPNTAHAGAGVSGAASMRVEVEVYKGPVGQSVEIQIGELSALLGETVKAMNGWQMSARRLRDPGLAQSLDANDLAALSQALASAAEVASAICGINDYRLQTWSEYQDIDFYPGDGCANYRKMRDNLEGLYGKTELDPPKDPPSTSEIANWLANTRVYATPASTKISKNYSDYSRRISVVASQMRVAAFRLVDAHVGYVPKSKDVRRAITGLNFQLIEMANSIAARNSNLQVLIERCSTTKACNEATKLPTSAYLRDGEPSRFMEAYDWFNAALPSAGTGALKQTDRIRAIKALTEDYYWEKVNEVYASGQGDVSMAFIKDDLGNWNLKSFSNDASKLLAAYRGVANAAMASAVRLASKAAGSPGALIQGNRVLDFASRVATGEGTASTSSVGGLSIDVLRQRTGARLTAARETIEAREKALWGSGSADSIENPGANSALKKLVDDEATKAIAAETALQRQIDEAKNGTDTAAYRAAHSATAQATKDRDVARDQLAMARGEATLLPGRAAELAQAILEDYQRDLAILQESLSASPAVDGEVPKVN